MLPYPNRLVKKRDVEKVFKLGQYASAGTVKINFLKNELEEVRIGVVVGLKFSSRAVIRNIMKRKIREILRKNLSRIKKGFDIVVSARPGKSGAEKMDSKKLENFLAEAFQRADLLKN